MFEELDLMIAELITSHPIRFDGYSMAYDGCGTSTTTTQTTVKQN